MNTISELFVEKCSFNSNTLDCFTLHNLSKGYFIENHFEGCLKSFIHLIYLKPPKIIKLNDVYDN